MRKCDNRLASYIFKHFSKFEYDCTLKLNSHNGLSPIQIKNKITVNDVIFAYYHLLGVANLKTHLRGLRFGG